MDKIEIPSSKIKLFFGIGGSILFVLAGFYLFTILANHQTRYDPTFLKVVGVGGIIFFGATGVYGIKKMFDKKVGLTIDENGIIDNTNASSIGLIKWVDITAIKTEKVMSTKFLLIYTNNPHKIFESVKGIKRKLLINNMKAYGTPLSITSNTLKFDFDKLEELLKSRLNQHRGKSGINS